MRIPLVLMLVVSGMSQVLCAEEIVLTTGEVLQAQVVELSDEALIAEHPVLGKLTIPRAAVISVDGRPLEPTAAAEGRNAEDTPEKATEPPATPPSAPVEPEKPDKPDWNSQIELSLSATDGGTQDANLRLGFRTTRKTERSLFRYDVAHRLTTSRGDRTENKFTTGAFMEWNRPDSPWSAFGQGRLDMDEFQAWDERVTLGGGAGYRLVDIKGADEAGKPFDLFNLTVRLGAGIRKEYGSPNEQIAPEGLLGAEFAYRISPHQQLSGQTTLYPDLRESGDFRVVSNLDWSIDIDRMDGISLKVGLVHEYEARTADRVPHNDIAARAGLVIAF